MQDYKYLLEKQIGIEVVENTNEKKDRRILKKFLIFLITLAILGISVGFIYLKTKNIKMFHIKSFQIVGIENSSKQKILNILKKNKDKPLKEIYDKLIKVKWVDDVILTRKLPSILVVKIIEKKPESLLQLNGQLYLIDKNGEIIDKYKNKYYQNDFIIFEIPGIKKYSDKERQKIAKILDVLSKYSFRDDISDITINGNELSIILEEPRLKVLISMDNLKSEIYKINILKRLANTEDVKNAAIAKLDYKDRIYLSRSE